MTARPAAFPVIATDANYTSGPKVGQATKVATDSALQQQGHLPETAPDAQKFNYWCSQVVTWLMYLDERLIGRALQLFDDDITTSAPEANSFKLNSGTPSAVTQIRLNDADVDSRSVVLLYQPPVSRLVINIHNTDRSIEHQYLVTQITDASGFTLWDVTHQGGTGAFVDGDQYSIDVDAAGAGTASGVTGAGSASMTWLSGAQSDSDPGDGAAGGDDADATQIEELYIDDVDAASISIAGWVGSFGSTRGPNKGRLRLHNASDPTRFHEYIVRKAEPQTGYTRLTVEWDRGNSTLLTTAGDLVVSFARSGDAQPGGETFIWKWKQNTQTHDPNTGYSKSNSASVPNTTQFRQDPRNADEVVVREWIESFPVGAVYVVRSVDDPAQWAHFEITEVTHPTGYHTIGVQTIVAADGDWTFDEDSLVSFTLVRGAGTGGSAGTGVAGIDAIIKPWFRTYTDPADVHTLSDSAALYDERLAEWEIFSFFDGTFPDGAGSSTGRVRSFKASYEQGQSGLTNLLNGASNTESWQVAATPGNNDEQFTAPLIAVAGPYPVVTPTTTRRFLGVSRTSGNGDASLKLKTSDDGGRSWIWRTLNRSDEVGPRDILFTGQNWLICYYDVSSPNYEISTDGGDTWTNVAKPDSISRFKLVSNQEGVVIGVGLSTYDVSTDHGVSFSAGSALNLDSGETVVGAVWQQYNRRFLLLTSNARYATSTDGVTWTPFDDVQFNHERFTAEFMRVRREWGLVVAGDALAALFYNTDPGLGTFPHDTDIFYSADGVNWKRSGQFGHGIAQDPSGPVRFRNRLISNTPFAVSAPDRIQLLLIPPYSTAGGFCTAYLSQVASPVRPASSTSSGGGSSGTSNALVRLNYDPTASIANPGSKDFRFDTADPADATKMAVHNLSLDNIDIADFLQNNGTAIAHIHNEDFSVRLEVQVVWYTDHGDWTELDIEQTGKGLGGLVAGSPYSIEFDLTGGNGPYVWNGTAVLVDSNPTNFSPDMLITPANLPGGPLTEGEAIAFEAELELIAAAPDFYGVAPRLWKYLFVMLWESGEAAPVINDPSASEGTTSATLEITHSSLPSDLGVQSGLVATIVSDGIRLQADYLAGWTAFCRLRGVSRFSAANGIRRYQ